VEVVESKVLYGCCEEFSRATFVLSVHRNPLYYIIRIVVPCCLLSFVAVFTYFLQPSRPERLAISENNFLLRNLTGAQNTIKTVGINDTMGTLKDVKAYSTHRRLKI